MHHLQQHCLATLTLQKQQYHYYSLEKASQLLGDVHQLPKSMKILLENLLRHYDQKSVQLADMQAIVEWLEKGHVEREIAYRPVRILMQDFTGVPAIVDLAAMREAVQNLGGDPLRVNPLSAVDLVIDHSVSVDEYAHKEAFLRNVKQEMQRNQERYTFLRWGQQSFKRFRVVPPGTGICHQVNLEYLGQTIWHEKKGDKHWLYPDTLVGTDSHTTMINGLGILGWVVGGIEAEAAMLGQPISMLLPDVVGFKLTGQLNAGITATDLVLTITQLLRKQGVVGKFVEFYGDGLAQLSVANRATIANMSPEFGATCAFFPVDELTLQYLLLSGRTSEHIERVESYCKAQGLWFKSNDEPHFSQTLQLDLSTVEACIAGPKRPQDRVSLSQVADTFMATQRKGISSVEISLADRKHTLSSGAVVIAAITSCTNTSNPSVMLAAGLLAKKAYGKGLQRKPWVKSSLAPGSKVVTDYLRETGTLPALEALGFYLVGYGCTTCIGNSGPLLAEIEQAIIQSDLNVAAVLSGNRNFEGRIHPLVKTNWLASPPLVVAYALAGSVLIDLTQDPLGEDKTGKPVYLADIWPSEDEIKNAVRKVNSAMYKKEYASIFAGDKIWQSIQQSKSETYSWQKKSTYIRLPPFFQGMQKKVKDIADIHQGRILAILGDSVTTDHISPAGSIQQNSPAGLYLREQGVDIADFNSYGSRRGNHEVMMRGTFANIRIRNEMLPGTEGGMTIHYPSEGSMSIFDAAMRYQQQQVPLVIIAGQEYGSGSSRDWAAKGPYLLGVKVVIAESFERIHRSNLIGMGILPLEFPKGVNRKTLQLSGKETLTVLGLNTLKPHSNLPVVITFANGKQQELEMLCRIDTHNELSYYHHGGILHYMIRHILEEEE